MNYDNAVSAVALSGNDIYVGGAIRTAGGVPAYVPDEETAALTVCTRLGQLLDMPVSGKSASAGGASANRIAKWEGNSWSVLGSASTITSMPSH